jgi:putative salt-induced outer membrane protein YdiY
MEKRNEFYDSKTHRIVRKKWMIVGYDNYCFAENKKLYNRTTGFEVRQVLKGGYTRGYNLVGIFFSLKKLRPLLRIEK